MHMGSGNDSINGFGGNDTVYGASGGDDTINGGTHTDGIGDVLSYIEYTGPVSISMIVDQSGMPQQSPHFLAQGWGNGTDEFFNFERIVLTNFNDLFVAETTVDAIQMQGIKIEARGGDDVIRSGIGDDQIFGGDGTDELYGGAGDDILIFDAADAFVFGGSGRDVGYALTADAVTLDLTASEIEVAIGGTGNDTITTGDSTETLMVAGGNGDDPITVSYGAGQGPRIVWGGAGADVQMTRGMIPTGYAANDDVAAMKAVAA